MFTFILNICQNKLLSANRKFHNSELVPNVVNSRKFTFIQIEYLFE